MRKHLFLFIFFLVFSFKGYCQLEKTTNQVGVSALPIFDVLKFFPDNKISGIAISGNLGYCTINRVSVGIQPYYAQVSNTYSNTLFERENQGIKLYGLNTYLRYYFISKEKFLIYSLASVGFGNSEQKTVNLSSQTFVKNSHSDKSVFTYMLGIGVNYFILKNIALELNIPYLNVKYISTDPNDNHFQTVAPSIGLQYYWK
jgi:opacity protein-like surface antigen